MKDLPKYKISIDDEYSDGEDLGISAIAFTATPAIKIKGFAFTATPTIEDKKQFFGDKVKNRIIAPAIIPMEIYRNDSDGEYYVQFTVNEIDKINQKFMKKFTNKNVFNLEHQEQEIVNAYILETWIVEDSETDKSFQSYGIKVPVGTLMVTSQIGDSDTYSKLVESKQTGYSIEGFLGLSLTEIINKQKLKQEKMNETKLSLPAGEYVMGDKTYIVAEDGTFTIKEEPIKEELADETPVDDKKEDKVVDEELADETTDAPVDDTTIVDNAPKSDSYSKEEIDAKFDEIYKIIGDLKAEDIAEDDTVDSIADVPVELSIHQKFAAISKLKDIKL